MEEIKVYAKADEESRILFVDAAWNIRDLAGWVPLDSGEGGDKYYLAQTHYFPEGLTNEAGAHLYRYDASRTPCYRESTPEEIAAELAARPVIQLEPTISQRLDATEAALLALMEV